MQGEQVWKTLVSLVRLGPVLSPDFSFNRVPGLSIFTPALIVSRAELSVILRLGEYHSYDSCRELDSDLFFFHKLQHSYGTCEPSLCQVRSMKGSLSVSSALHIVEDRLLGPQERQPEEEHAELASMTRDPFGIQG